MRTRKVSVTFGRRAQESKHHKSPRMYYWNKHRECYFVQSSNFVLVEVKFHNERVYYIFTYKKLLERTGGVELNYLFIQMTIETKMICLNIACHRPVWFHKMIHVLAKLLSFFFFFLSKDTDNTDDWCHANVKHSK